MSDAGAAVAEIERRLRALGTPERAAAEKAYLKSDLEFVGTSVPQMRQTVRFWAAHQQPLDRDDLIGLVQALWHRPVHECRAAAVDLLETHVGLLTPADSGLIEQLLRESRTWALLDNLAASVMGPLVRQFPELTATLDRWSRDDDFWLRRASMLALLLPLRDGAGDFTRFAAYADAMLEEKEFFIRKAIGWVLRETAKKHPEMVVHWLAPRMTRASVVTVREALKPLSPEVREELLGTRTATRRAPRNKPHG